MINSYYIESCAHLSLLSLRFLKIGWCKRFVWRSLLALHGLLAYPALDSPIRRSPSLPLDEAGRNPLHPPFLYVLDRRTTDEQTNQTEEFVKVIPFPSQHLPSQHGELIHFLYCSNALNWLLLFWETVTCGCFPELKLGANLFLWFRFIARLIIPSKERNSILLFFFSFCL